MLATTQAQPTVLGVLDHPAYNELLIEDLSAFTDSDGDVVLVSPGTLDRIEMADRCYLLLASRLGVARVRELLSAYTPMQPEEYFQVLVARVHWFAITIAGDGLQLVDLDCGVPVTILALNGVVECDELLLR